MGRVVWVLFLVAMTASGQTGGLLPGQQSVIKEKPAVVFLFPEQVTVTAGKPQTVALHFRVAEGLHINSHLPKDKFLIATTLTIPDGAGVRLDGAQFPPGVEMVLPLDPGTKLSVYSGEFVVEARLVAEKGDHLVEGKLRYQACDNNACQPPRVLSVAVDVLGR
jgi:hypothetical protein